MPELTIDWGEESLKELQTALEQLARADKQTAYRAVLPTAEGLLRRVKNAAPVDTGNLRRGLVLVAEHNRPQGKQAMQVVPTSRMNSVFQRQVIRPGRSASGKKRRTTAYYPASQEYGFATRSGGYVPGRHYMADSMRTGSAAMEKQIIHSLNTELDKIWK